MLPPPAEKAAAVRRLFNAIAPRYDLLNHLLSLNFDRRWRRRAVARLLDGGRGGPTRGGSGTSGLYLDACAGTLDLAVELVRQAGTCARVVAADFSLHMLQCGRRKLSGGMIRLACADTLRLPFPDGRLDAGIVGFGVRNLADLDAGLRELVRVLRPGGRLVVLEFGIPTGRLFRRLYLFYFRRLLPWIGRLASGHQSAYSYLPASVLEFPAAEPLARRMEGAGLERVRWEKLTGGIATIHVGEKR
ncbi:MAG: ubiquinone/menaquinone biosynthesis methyltransferase [Gemmatimonadetes bacterium]|nr:ubiquinone/menaquinone biosynthesis methyltransferase [Gemmatimonadota bacterium]